MKILTKEQFGYLPKEWNIWHWITDKANGKLVHPIPHGHCETIRAAEDYANSWPKHLPKCEFIFVKDEGGEGGLLFRVDSVVE